MPAAGTPPQDGRPPRPDRRLVPASNSERAILLLCGAIAAAIRAAFAMSFIA